MKKVFLLLVSFALVSFTSCNEDASKKVDEKKVAEASEKTAQEDKFPVLSFDTKEHDFGNVEEGDVVEHTFTFTNTGDAPLIISNAKASCGCTVPSYPKNEAIAPGDQGDMTVKFNTRGKPNQQMKTVTITANTESGRETIRIKAFVNPKEGGAKAGSPVK